MTILYLAAPALAFVLLGAHFLRAGNWLSIAACVVMIALLLVRRRWAARMIQAALVLGAIEWLRLAFTLVVARRTMGQPFLRLAFILGGIAVLTALSALVFRNSRIRARFGLDAVARDLCAP